MTIDYQDNVQLCCAVFDSQKFTLGSFLDADLTSLQGLKYSGKSEETCSNCMKYGIHIYATYGTKDLNKVAIANILSKNLPRGLRMYFFDILLNTYPLKQFTGLPVRAFRKAQKIANGLI